MIQRIRITLRGAVQGVGFRPFVFRLATELKLHGWVSNSPHGVVIEAEGSEESVRRLLVRLQSDKPPLAFITSLEPTILTPIGYSDFEIRTSDCGEHPSAIVLPDIAACAECVREICDPHNRRYQYPFTNCTHCGPRYSIIESLPYDRARTTMKKFSMCPDCLREYEDPTNRRFHAQPNACPTCGPHLELWEADGQSAAREHAALLETVRRLCAGQIIALKGMGGFQLLVDARNEAAVRRLRQRKRREEKPFALMFPTLDLIETHACVSELERRVLLSPEAPIVLLERRADSSIPEAVAPGNPYLGILLPTTPLHHLLMREINAPVIATSGNLSDEPICVDEYEAVDRLREIADSFLVHDRPILRHVDDSIVRVILGREMVLRRARGYAPLPIHLHPTTESVILAVGGHLKNTIAFGSADRAIVSQHIGDLETEPTYRAFRHTITQLSELYDLKPTHVACDAHPDYHSTLYAQRSELPVIPVQHHYAHALACMTENEISPPCLGIVWDGTGYGTDGTIWGGEFLTVNPIGFDRTAWFRTFFLPGGDRAIREPRRSALGVLYEMYGNSVGSRTDIQKVFSGRELDSLLRMMNAGSSMVRTSSVGRLFDTVASIIGLRYHVRFEGQAAMELEFAMHDTQTMGTYPISIRKEPGGLIVDWFPMMESILNSVRASEPIALISARFHQALVSAAVDVAHRIGIENIVLSGGCFQNRYLLEHIVHRLQKDGFRVFWHQRIPPNDGGIAVGQIAGAVRNLTQENLHVPGRSR
jgi:hydrogenase maturation protein HypF